MSDKEPIQDVIGRLKEQRSRECGVSSFMQLDAVDFDRLLAEIEQLRGLAEYAQHLRLCPGTPHPQDGRKTVSGVCTCGLAEKLGEL